MLYSLSFSFVSYDFLPRAHPFAVQSWACKCEHDADNLTFFIFPLMNHRTKVCFFVDEYSKKKKKKVVLWSRRAGDVKQHSYSEYVIV